MSHNHNQHRPESGAAPPPPVVVPSYTPALGLVNLATNITSDAITESLKTVWSNSESFNDHAFYTTALRARVAEAFVDAYTKVTHALTQQGIRGELAIRAVLYQVLNAWKPRAFESLRRSFCLRLDVYEETDHQQWGKTRVFKKDFIFRMKTLNRANNVGVYFFAAAMVRQTNEAIQEGNYSSLMLTVHDDKSVKQVRPAISSTATLKAACDWWKTLTDVASQKSEALKSSLRARANGYSFVQARESLAAKFLELSGKSLEDIIAAYNSGVVVTKFPLQHPTIPGVCSSLTDLARKCKDNNVFHWQFWDWLTDEERIAAVFWNVFASVFFGDMSVVHNFWGSVFSLKNTFQECGFVLKNAPESALTESGHYFLCYKSEEKEQSANEEDDEKQAVEARNNSAAPSPPRQRDYRDHVHSVHGRRNATVQRNLSQFDINAASEHGSQSDNNNNNNNSNNNEQPSGSAASGVSHGSNSENEEEGVGERDDEQEDEEDEEDIDVQRTGNNNRNTNQRKRSRKVAIESSSDSDSESGSESSSDSSSSENARKQRKPAKKSKKVNAHSRPSNSNNKNKNPRAGVFVFKEFMNSQRDGDEEGVTNAVRAVIDKQTGAFLKRVQKNLAQRWGVSTSAEREVLDGFVIRSMIATLEEHLEESDHDNSESD